MKCVADYAMIGDLRSTALVAKNGAIEWFCAPRFDSDALFAAMLGDDTNGYWRIAPRTVDCTHERRYIDDTLILETTFRTATGCVRLIDFMVFGAEHRTIVRVLEGLDGSVECAMTFAPKMRYGAIEPKFFHDRGGWSARLAPQAVHLQSSADCTVHTNQLTAAFTIEAGQRMNFVLHAFDSFLSAPDPIDAWVAYDATHAWWSAWSSRLQCEGQWRDAVVRSAIMIKALAFEPAGSFAAAATTSLPEQIGGSKNWDYRYCWLRDGSFAVEALLSLGAKTEAERWRTWLVDVCAGKPELLHVMYQLDGQALPAQRTLPWLTGFANSTPVHVSNGAHEQFQLGIYGDVIRMFAHAQAAGVSFDESDWDFIEAIMSYVEIIWQRPDNGIWETRTGGRQYVASRVMAWVAINHGLKIATAGDFKTDTARWTTLKDRMHAEICRAGFDPDRNTFTQYYGSLELDASLLLIPLVGFLEPHDERVLGTIAAIEQHLMVDGHVFRYSADNPHDGLPKEGAFLMCGFWLAETYELVGRHADARALFQRLIATANDVGILAEEFDTSRKIAIGNIPQAFSHIGAIQAACRLSGHISP